MPIEKRVNSMFGYWSKSRKSIEEQQRKFDKAYQMIVEISRVLRREYDRVLRDPNISAEVDGILKQYDSPDFLSESRDAIFAMRRDKQFSSAYSILKTSSLMLLTMIDHAFPILSVMKPSFQKDDLASFAYWVSCLSPDKRKDVVRFAYIAMVDEQQKSGNKSETALAMRILLVTLAANANDDDRSKQIARELLALVDGR